MKSQCILTAIAVAGLLSCLLLLAFLWSQHDATPQEALERGKSREENDARAVRRSPQIVETPERPAADETVDDAPIPSTWKEKPEEARRARLVVVAAESEVDLAQVRIVESRRTDLSRVEHPGNFADCPELARGRSPLALPVRFELWDRLAILAPGREALFISLDPRSDVDRRLELRMGADLQVDLLGFEADDFQGMKTRLFLRREDAQRTILVDRPADLGRQFELTHLSPGPAILSIERYPMDSAPPLARTRVALAPGARELVQLKRLPDPLRIPISGQVVLPRFLQAQEYTHLHFHRAGLDFRVEAYASREPADARALDFSAELPFIGPWTVEIEGQDFDFEVGAEGRDDLHFLVAERARLVLSFSGLEARDLFVTWTAPGRRGLALLDEQAKTQVINAPSGVIEVQLESDHGFQVEELEVPPEGLATTIAVRPPVGFWLGAKFEDIHVQMDIAPLLEIERLDPGPFRRRLLLEDPFRCRIALTEPGRYRLGLREAPAGYRRPEPIIIDLRPDQIEKLAFVLEKNP